MSFRLSLNAVDLIYLLLAHTFISVNRTEESLFGSEPISSGFSIIHKWFD